MVLFSAHSFYPNSNLIDFIGLYFSTYVYNLKMLQLEKLKNGSIELFLVFTILE